MPKRKTLKRRNAKRRTLKRFKKKSKGGTEGDNNLPVADTNNPSIIDSLSKKAKVLATTLRVLPPYKNCLYLDGYNHSPTYDGLTPVEYYLGKGSNKIHDPNDRAIISYTYSNKVIAFPEPEYLRGINNYIYRNEVKQEEKDLFDEDGNFMFNKHKKTIPLQASGEAYDLVRNYPRENTVKYIFLAINYK